MAWLMAALTWTKSRGPELEPQVEVVEPVVQVASGPGVSGAIVSRPPGCSRMRSAVRLLERAQLLEVGLGQRIEHAQHEHPLAVGQRHFDLRNARAALMPVSSSASGADQRADRLGQHLATLHVRDVLALLLAKADEAAALLRDVARRRAARAAGSSSAGPTTAAATRRASTLPMRSRFSASSFCLAASCAAGLEVLQRAAAAHAEVRAARRHASRRRLEHFDELGLIVLLVKAARGGSCMRSPGKRARDEHRLAPASRVAHHALAFVREIGDDAGLDGGVGRARRLDHGSTVPGAQELVEMRLLGLGAARRACAPAPRRGRSSVSRPRMSWKRRKTR